MPLAITEARQRIAISAAILIITLIFVVTLILLILTLFDIARA